jgi:hypothetical protein
MTTKPQAPGQWAQQQKVAEKKKAEKQPQMEQSSGQDAEPMEEPAKKHGDKMQPTTPEDQGGIAGP